MALKHDLFHALGDPTRMEIVRRLGERGSQTTCHLLEGLGMSRQAASKHLRLLEETGIVNKKNQGREIVRSLDAQALSEAGDWLIQRARAWDEKLAALKKYVESD